MRDTRTEARELRSYLDSVHEVYGTDEEITVEDDVERLRHE